MSIYTLNRSGYRYLLLLPITLLLFNAMFYHYATKEIDDVLLKDKFKEVAECLDVLAVSLSAEVAKPTTSCEDSVKRAMEYIDNLYQVYAGAYALVDDELVLISERNYETSIFEPLDYPEFTMMIRDHNLGEIVIGYTPEQQTYRELHLYFRWLTASPETEKYLLVAGVSEYSVTVSVALWVSIGQWVSTAVTFFLQAWLVVLIVRLGDEEDHAAAIK